MAETFQTEPIISVLTGYQRYFAKPPAQPKVFSRRSAFSESFDLYKVRRGAASIERKGLFVGNHGFVYTYKDVGTITPKQETELTNVFIAKYPKKGAENLSKITKDISSGKSLGVEKFNNGGTMIPVQKAPSGEEQVQMFDGNVIDKSQPGPRGGFGGPQPVDIRGRFQAKGKYSATSGYEVTTKRLDTLGHHGIYGKEGAGKELQTRLAGAKSDDEKAEIGKEYFRGRMKQWNVAMRSLQEKPKKIKLQSQAMSLRSQLPTGDEVIDIRPLSNDAHRGMMAKSTGAFGETAAEMTRHALGSMAHFGSEHGVSYTFVIDSHTHAILQNFRLDRDSKNRIVWDREALKHAFAVKGIMATDEIFRLHNITKSQNEGAVRRAHAQTATRANKNMTSTTIGKEMSVQTGEMRTKSRLHASIDMISADRDMATLIKEHMIPYFQEQSAKNVKQFSKEYIGLPEAIPMKDNFVTRGGSARYRAWAAPYITMTDYTFEAFGE